MQLRQLPDNQSMAREEKEEEGDEEEDGDEMAGSCPGSVRHIWELADWGKELAYNSTSAIAVAA